MQKKYWIRSVFIALFSIITVKSLVQASNNSDSRIEAAFRNSLVYNSYLAGNKEEVGIKSRNGVVTLTGSVSNNVEKTLAESTAENIAGVKSVNNQLEVVGEQKDGDSDGWIATKIKTVLMFRRNVSGSKTDVMVKDGVVTLRGIADSQAQKELTTKYAQDIEGVRKVNNEMNVEVSSPDESKRATTTTVDDASITAQVKMSLLFHSSTSALRTDVETNEGVVTVSGKAKNAAEKDLVTELISDIRGVKRVINKMSVAVDNNG